MNPLLGDQKEKRRGNPLLGGGSSKRRGNPLLGGDGKPTIESEVSDLETLAELTGAPSIPQESPGLFRRVVDVLSRPNYAVAGAVQELIRGKPGEVPARIAKELLSGIGGIKGEKKGFGQVMEEAGVGTLGSLSDVAPFLYSETGEGLPLKKGGSFDPTGRGTTGLVLDIAADPLTYLTFGSATAGRVTLKSGTKFLNKAGMNEWGRVFAGAAPKLEAAAKIGDAAIRRKEEIKILSEATDAFEKVLRPEWLDKSGVKLFGHTIIPKSAFDTLGTKTVETLRAVPGGDMAVNGTAAFAQASRKAIDSVFSAFPRLAELPKGMRQYGVKMHRDAVTTKAIVEGNLFQEWAVLKKDWDRLVKGDAELGKKFYGLREGWANPNLTTEQKELYDKLVALQDRMTATGVKLGIITEEELLKGAGYFHHSYLNAEELPSVEAAINPVRSATSPKFLKERPFKTYREAEEKSAQLNKITGQAKAVGQAQKVYPILQPDYDVLHNMAQYIDQFSTGVARKQWTDEAITAWGLPVGKFDVDAIYDISTPVKLFPGSTDRQVIDSFLGSSKTVTQLEEYVQAAAAIHPHTRDFIRRSIIKLDQATLTARGLKRDVGGFTRANDSIGSALAEKFRRGTELTAEEWTEARRIFKEQRSQIESLFWPEKVHTFWTEPINRSEASDMFLGEVSKLADRLSPQGKEELFRELMLRSGSASGAARIMLLHEKYGKWMPKPKAVSVGDVEPYFEAFGEKAAYIEKAGGVWGDKPVLVPKAIADDIENLNSRLLKNRELGPGFKKMIAGYDWLNNWFKIGAYALWPAAASRDLYNNVGQAFFDVSVGALGRGAETAKVLAGKGKVVLNGREWDAAALKNLMYDMGVTDKSGRAFAQFVGQRLELPGPVSKVIQKRMMVENWTRAQLWLNNIHRGLDPREAADKVRKFLFDYGELNPIEREIFRRVIPFYTFPRKAIALHLEAIGKTPGRVINELKPFRGRDDENGQMTSWEGEAFKLRLDRDGKTLTMLTGIDMPIRSFDTIWAGSLRDTLRQQLGMISPIFKFPAEVSQHRLLFSGRELDRTQNTAMGMIIQHAPKGLQDWMGYKKETDAAGRTRYTFDGERFYVFFQSWALSRLVSTSERQFRTLANQPGMAPVFLDVLTGLRYKELNLDEEMQRRLKERIKELQRANVRRGNLVEGQHYFKPQ